MSTDGFKPHYLIDKILPVNHVHILAGASGSGKSTLMMQLARCLLDGQPWMGHPVLPDLRIGYVGTDRDTTAYRHKFHVTGIPPFDVQSLIDSKKYRPTECKNFPEKWLEIVYRMGERPDVLFIDPISCFLPARIADYHANADVLILINRFCREFGVTIIGSYHAGKLKAEQGFMRAQDRILGSGALLAFSDTQIFLTDADEIPKRPGYHLLTINPHDSPKEEHRLGRNSATGAFEPWIDVDTYTQEQKILKVIPFEPEMLTTGEVLASGAEAIDKCQKTVTRVLKTLLDDGFIDQPQRGYYSRRKTC